MLRKKTGPGRAGAARGPEPPGKKLTRIAPEGPCVLEAGGRKEADRGQDPGRRKTCFSAEKGTRSAELEL